MEELIGKSTRIVARQSLAFKRALYNTIDWSNRLVGIMGARGTGKTTLQNPAVAFWLFVIKR